MVPHPALSLQDVVPTYSIAELVGVKILMLRIHRINRLFGKSVFTLTGSLSPAANNATTPDQMFFL